MRASVSVLIHTRHPLRVLLLRRPESRAGGWQFVTGSLEDVDGAEADDAAHRAAAIREIHEETGFSRPERLDDLGFETTFVGHDGETYVQRAYLARYPSAETPSVSGEHEEVKWVAVDAARRLLKWDQDKAALDRLVARTDREI